MFDFHAALPTISYDFSSLSHAKITYLDQEKAKGKRDGHKIELDRNGKTQLVHPFPLGLRTKGAEAANLKNI